MDDNQSKQVFHDSLPSPSAEDELSYSAYIEKHSQKPGTTNSTSDTLSSFASAMKDNIKVAQAKLSTGFYKAAAKFDQVLTQAEPNMPCEDASSLTLMLADQLQCGWCKQLLNGPVTLPCGHSYCNGCWQQVNSLPTQPPVCPCDDCREPAPANPPLSVSLCGVSAILRSRIETEKALLAQQAAHVTDNEHLPLELATETDSGAENGGEGRYAQNPYEEPVVENYSDLLAEPGQEQAKEGRFYKLWDSVKERGAVIGSQLKEIGEKAHQGMSEVAIRAQQQYGQSRASRNSDAASYGLESDTTTANVSDNKDIVCHPENTQDNSTIDTNNVGVEEDERFSLE